MPEQNQIDNNQSNLSWSANSDGSWSPSMPNQMGMNNAFQGQNITQNADGTYRVLGFVTPPPIDFDTEEMRGSIQYILSKNVGEYVVVEFLIGTQEITRKQGILFYVGTSFITLYDDFLNNFIVCDVFSIKFVYFYFPGQRPDFNVNVLPMDEVTSLPPRTTTGGSAAGMSPNSIRNRNTPPQRR